MSDKKCINCGILVPGPYNQERCSRASWHEDVVGAPCPKCGACTATLWQEAKTRRLYLVWAHTQMSTISHRDDARIADMCECGNISWRKGWQYLAPRR